MPEQTPSQATNLQRSVPPTVNAGHFVLGASVGEISVIFGQTRLRPVVQNGQMKAASLVEWFTTITMSPMVARQLYEALGTTLDGYTEQFGAIPAEPTKKKDKK